ncbi:unnamed protein product, partial [Larinioides sclopetarius]
EIVIEIAHKLKNIKPTIEGYTHDWTLFVQGVNGNEIKHIVKKLYFIYLTVIPTLCQLDNSSPTWNVRHKRFQPPSCQRNVITRTWNVQIPGRLFLTKSPSYSHLHCAIREGEYVWTDFGPYIRRPPKHSKPLSPKRKMPDSTSLSSPAKEKLTKDSKSLLSTLDVKEPPLPAPPETSKKDRREMSIVKPSPAPLFLEKPPFVSEKPAERLSTCTTIPHPSLPTAIRKVATWKLCQTHKPPSHYFHKHSVNFVLAIREGEYVLTDRFRSMERMDRNGWMTELAEDVIYASRQARSLYCVDAITYELLQKAIKTWSPQHRIHQMTLNRFEEFHKLGPCSFCMNTNCVRWLAIRGGVQKFF